MITATFLDEITHDIPSNNWGPEEWRADFAAMRAVGIDTVVVIRVGYRDRCCFPSRVLANRGFIRATGVDLVGLFLDLAAEQGMGCMIGLFDSGSHWDGGDLVAEAELNRAVIAELGSRYGGHRAFAGWYCSHELCTYEPAQLAMAREVAGACKLTRDLPVLMSPFVRGRKLVDAPATLADHCRDWETILAGLRGRVDIVAFQDGQVGFEELPVFTAANVAMARSHGMTPWANIETFERGMPINFLPIGWDNLRYKLEVARAAGVERCITFEFSHFLSPHSMYPSAHHLYRRYQEWLHGQ
jgi:hypothetical protein